MSVDVLMPRLSDTMEEGLIDQWLCATGDVVAVGQDIAEIETDKATVVIAAEAAGVVLQLVDEGTAVSVGSPIARIGTAEEASAGRPAASSSTAGQPNAGTSADSVDVLTAPVALPAPAPASAAELVHPTSERVLITPLARRIAHSAGLRDLAILGPGSGPRGRIHKADVERYLAQDRVAPNASSADETLEPTRLQALIAQRMVTAKTEVPHYYLTMPVSVGSVESLRRSLTEHLTTRPSLTDFIMLACARALRSVPEVNSAWVDGLLVRRGGVHIGLAVALDDGGLVVPVLRDIDSLSIAEVAERRTDLVERARLRKLNPREMEGGTFSVSNLGAFGVDEFHAIVNPPESGILAVGGIRQELAMEDGEIVARPTMRMSLSADHRVYSGATGAIFLKEVRDRLEQPLSLLVGPANGR